MESPAGSYALSRQPEVLPTVGFSPATTVEFIPAANTMSDPSQGGSTGWLRLQPFEDIDRASVIEILCLWLAGRLTVRPPSYQRHDPRAVDRGRCGFESRSAIRMDKS